MSHYDATPKDAPRPDVDAPTLHAAYAPPLPVSQALYANAQGSTAAPSPTTDEGPEEL